jgi:hypothetical protein
MESLAGRTQPRRVRVRNPAWWDRNDPDLFVVVDDKTTPLTPPVHEARDCSLRAQHPRRQDLTTQRE